MPLLVKPNPRRAQAFMNSPSERSFVRQRSFMRRRGSVLPPAFGQFFLAIAVLGVILLGLKFLAVI